MVSAKRNTLWGAIVGAFVAIAFHFLLGIQFDAELNPLALLVTVPVCAFVGAAFGWAWSRMIDRSR